MIMLVTLEQASDHLRRDTTDDDDDLILKIKAVSNAISNYVKDRNRLFQIETDEFGYPVLDSDGDVVYLRDSAGDLLPKEEVQQAALIMIGVVYADREAKEYIDPRASADMQRLGNISVPRAVHWLLDPIRDPTLG